MHVQPIQTVITCKRISAPVQHLINVLMMRRIWRATDLEKLKLSPARLAYVRHAELNSLPSVFHDLSNLETLTCNGRKWVTDLSALWSSFNLHTLNLNHYDHFHVLTNSDIAALGNCSQLRSLTLSQCRELTDITALGSCCSLHTLDLSPCTNLTNISALRNCSSLGSLTLLNCRKLTDITALRNCSSLDSLCMRNCDLLTDITAIGSCRNLDSLDLSDCSQLVDITAIGSCRNLASLDLSDCSQLVDITSLGSCGNLRQLFLRTSVYSRCPA